MVIQLLKFQFLKSFRSVSFTKNMLSSFFVGLFVFIILFYLLVVAFLLGKLLTEGFNAEDPLLFLNSVLFFVFLTEFITRYFMQKLPILELESLLHLPISVSKLVHFLLIKSVFTPFSILILLLFGPFAFMEIAPEYGKSAAWQWLLTLVFVSWFLHWFSLWFKKVSSDSLLGIGAIVLVYAIGFGSVYFGYFNLGDLFAPVFNYALASPVPFLLSAGVCLSGYFLLYRYHVNNAWLEETTTKNTNRFLNQSLGFLSRFGLAGELADAEWKLIIRHKKSRNYLFISLLFLAYGLLFYGNPTYGEPGEFSAVYLFLGIFITGVFIIQYGQLFLSWNSANFDFYMLRSNGIEALIQGKYLLFVIISVICFVLSVPYVYFGWNVLFTHLASLLFNLGVSIHLVVYLALWQPKPMNLNKSALFNYEGVGIAQFLIFIPLLVAPYAVFLPLYFMFDYTVGLLVLSFTGIAGILFSRNLVQIAVNMVERDKYEISSSFRQES